jgi:regulator of sigma E protease
MDILIKAGQLILSLSILVILHEMGHFFFARLFNTRVEKFYLFFDAWFSLFKFKKGDTEYGIGWIPLGGYVKISGMIDESMDKEQMAQPAQPWEFRSKPTWQRLLIMIGGVVVNFIAAIVIFWMLLYKYGESYIPVTSAKYGLYYHEMVHELGVKDGDIILKADTFQIETADQISKFLVLHDVKQLTIKRNDSTFTVAVPDDFGQKLIGANVKSVADIRIPFVVDTIIPKMGAAQGGMLKGDSVIAVNEQSTAWFHEFAQVMDKNKGKDVTITVMRDTSIVKLICHVSDKGKVGAGNNSAMKNFEVKTNEYGFWAAFPAGLDRGMTTLSNYAKGLKKVFTKEGVTQMGGFGAMGSLFSPTWDWASFWSLTAIISIILAFMNILPIPALDGGHVLFLLYEIITRRKPSDKFLEYATLAGMIFVIGLILFANGNDVYKWISETFFKN